MRYTKPALSFEQQAQRLIDRGLIVKDKTMLVKCLSTVNYYRLSAYWYPFKRTNPATGSEHFAPHTTFEMIWRRYTFDRELRLLVMDALERVEIAVLRTRLVEQFTLLYGPFGYCNLRNFNPRFPESDYHRLMDELNDAVSRSKEEFVGRFRRKYTSETHLPLWIAAELMTFRNACAHHTRLWNRELPIRPKLPDKHHRPEWYIPAPIDNTRIFSVLTLLRYLLSYVAPLEGWSVRLEQLLDAYSEISIRSMGFPLNWHDCLIWKISP